MFNTPGANANAVKELVIAGMLMAVSVRGTGTGLSLAPAVELFSGPSLEDGGLYDVAGEDGGLLDSDDELVFLFKDSGPQAPVDATWPAGATTF